MIHHSYSRKGTIPTAIGLLILVAAIVLFTNPLNRVVAAKATQPDELNSSPDSKTAITPDARQALHAAYGKLPLRFEVNSGQTDPAARYIARTEGTTLFLTSTGAVLTLQSRSKQSPHSLTERPAPISAAAIRMNWVGADPNAEVVGQDRLPGNSNYFKGNVSSQWQTNVPTFARVQYRRLYNGINLVYYGNQRQIEYDFEVAPGGDPGAIKMAFAGIQKFSLDHDGDLILHTARGDVRMQKPTVYQEADGTRQPIEGRYVIKGAQQVGFQVGHYDRTRALVIDPVLSYSTFLGGSSDDTGTSMAIDAAGNAYVTGTTISSNFPTTAGGYNTTYASGLDIFVAKLSADGSAIVYSTYLGGRFDDQANHIAIDSAGNAYVTGSTLSSDFPVTSGAYQTAYHGTFTRGNAFVTKLNSTGSALTFSTYLGGAGSQDSIGGDAGYGLDVDSQGNVYVAGAALSRDFPTTAGAFQPAASQSTSADGFITKLNSAGTGLIYSTYLGGLGGDQVQAIKITPSGEAIVTGSTNSIDFPTTSGVFQAAYAGSNDTFNSNDVFVSRLNATGTGLVYSTYVGGTRSDNVMSLALGPAGEVYLTGTTNSVDFPTTAGVIGVANGGVARITNGVGGWSNRSAGLTFSEILTMAINPVDPSVLYAAGVGAVFKSTDGGGSWHIPAASPATTFRCSAIDPTNPSIVYMGGYGSGVYKTTDAGATWASINTGLQSLTILALKVDPTNPQTVYTLNRDGANKSTDGGNHWTLVRPSLDEGLAIDPNHPATLYAGMPTALFKSTNGGGTWNITSLRATPNVIAVDPSNSATVYVGTFGGVYKSTDSGSHWQAVNAGLTDRNIFDLTISPADSSIIYVGTEQGVFRTTNAGATWEATSPGLAGAATQAVVINPLNPLIVYAGNEGGNFDAFVTKLNANATALSYSTYLGGLYVESGNDIAVDSSGNAYVTGNTSSPDFPTTRGGFGLPFSPVIGPEAAFVSKLNPGGTSLVYSTSIGGSQSSAGQSIALNTSGNAYIAGTTKAPNFPTTPGAFQTTLSGSSDAFVSRLVPDPHLNSDLSISITATPTGQLPITTSTLVEFQITVTNNGPDPAYSVTVHDDLPTSLTFDDCTSGGNSQCDGVGTGILGSRGKLEVGDVMTIVYFATVSCSIDNNLTVSNTATVDSASFDSNASNNSATTSLSVANPTTALSPSSQAFPVSGGNGTANVTRGSICNWEAQSNAEWITITSSAGCCDGPVNYSVAANNSITPRTGTMTIAGKAFTVTQAAMACNFSISPSSRSHGSGAESDIVAVSASAGCNWTAISNAPWITVTAGSSGSGNGSVAYTLTPNSASSQRSGTITVAGQTFTVNQAGVSCVDSLAAQFTAAAATGRLKISASAGCLWTAMSNDSWITMTSATTGTGPGTLTYSIAANSTALQRTGSIVVSGQRYLIAQDGQSCTFSLSPGSATVAASGGTGNVNVNTVSGCNWSAASNVSWIRITAGASGSASSAVSYTVDPNPGSSPRTGTMTVAGQTFTVTQSGSGIVVVTPNGGESWVKGTTQVIRWAYSSAAGSQVKIELLKGGVLNTTIATKASIGSGGSGSFSWLVPSTLNKASDYQIRITSVSAPSFTDTSDGMFSVTNSIASIHKSRRQGENLIGWLSPDQNSYFLNVAHQNQETSYQAVAPETKFGQSSNYSGFLVMMGGILGLSILLRLV